MTGVSNAADLEPNLPDNAYGQARVNVSPLRMAQLAAAVANGGFRVEPVLLAKQYTRIRVLEESTAATLRRWMQEVVDRGTGRAAAIPGLVIGGKTGTAQTEAGDRMSHSWFIGFAYPIGSGPEDSIAFAFLIENGGYGGRAAATAAGAFLRESFHEQ
jgi:cell division protein FtsI/penicillin-binding protein 2